MNLIQILNIILLLKLAEANIQIQSQGVPWPLPKSIVFGSMNISLDPSILDIHTDTVCPLITQSVQRYKNIILKERGPKSRNPRRRRVSSFKSLRITIDSEMDCDQYPYLGMKENYRLSVNDTGYGYLHAETVWGVLRGLETFSQLIYPIDHQLRIRTVSIDDEPRFEHRGILFDTSRHFVSVNTLKKNLDLMAFGKFNVFHWHLVDDPSFPYVSSIYPNLSQGAYSKKHLYSAKVRLRNLGHVTIGHIWHGHMSRDQPECPEAHCAIFQDIQDLVDYARSRGIRVMAEFDTPGHALSWGVGQPNLLTQCFRQGIPTYDYGVIDPTLPSTYEFMHGLFAEIAQRFPDRYLHLGSDEVSFECWRSNGNIQNFMRRMNMTAGQEWKLEEYYIQKLMQSIKSIRNQSFLVWQEVLDNGANLDPNTVIHVWKGDYSIQWGLELFKATRRGFKAILSSCWYLNLPSGRYGQAWEPYYHCDPHHFIGSKDQKSLVIGGEACMWGEYADASNLLAFLWPRASVVAERLWSPANVDDVDRAKPRLEEHRCRLIRRGYPAAPILGPGYCQIEWET